MTFRTLVDLSAVLEPWIVMAVGVLLVALVADRMLSGRHDLRGPVLEAPLATTTECGLLAGIVLVAMFLRLVGWDASLTPAWWFSEVSVLPVDKMLRDGSLWAVWRQQLGSTRINFAHEATSVLPLLAALDVLLGPRFGLSVVAGGFTGGLVVLVAWALGRQVKSQAFGLVFAALVAFSPMQLMWSRLSPMCTEAVVHALLALLIGWITGRRGRLGLAVVTGLLAWTSFQQYYAARAALPLAMVGIVAGALRSKRPARGLPLVLVALLSFGLMQRAVQGAAFAEGFWPAYQGYLGNRGERSVFELIERNSGPVIHEAGTTLARYFWTRRTGWDSDARRPGIAEGGLSSPAMGLLGVVGLFAVLRGYRSQWPWLVIAVIGLAMPSFSAASARRMLLFDVAWCSFAAHGLLALADGLGARFSYATRASVVAATIVLLALWSSLAVFGLSATMPASYGQHIPFGEAGFGDGIMCKRCLQAAKGWQQDIADGSFVVLFDNDAFRENRTGPGGLPAFGKIAALAAGRREAFVEGYGIMAGWDPEPPTAGPMFDRSKSTFIDELQARMERVAPRQIVWHFERPTAWERWLADRLRAAGGVLETFGTELSPRGGIRVITPVARRADAMAVIRELATGLASGGTSCFGLVEAGVSPSPGNVFLLATGDDGMDRPPEWIAASWQLHRYGTYELSTPSTPLGVHVVGNGRVEHAEFLCQDGGASIVDVPSLERHDVPSVVRADEFGLNCAAWSAGHWWLVEPMSGRVVSSHPAAAVIPSDAWIAIAAGPSEEIVLASAKQEILVFDPAHQRIVTRFPARVPPSVRITADECTPMAVGSDWIAIANLRTTVLSLYTLDGRDLGTQRLDRLVNTSAWISTIGGAGRYVGVPSDSDGVKTFEVKLDPTCTEGATAAR